MIAPTFTVQHPSAEVVRLPDPTSSRAMVRLQTLLFLSPSSMRRRAQPPRSSLLRATLPVARDLLWRC